MSGICEGRVGDPFTPFYPSELPRDEEVLANPVDHGGNHIYSVGGESTLTCVPHVSMFYAWER
jgi:hypothetical protein